MRVVVAVLSLAALATSQAEPRPRTTLERVIDDKLPSVVKVFGASGLATIDPFATGIVVSAQGHVLTLDLVMVQPGQTRVVLADGSVHDAEVLPADHELGVRMLKIDPGDRALVPVEPTTRTDWRHGTFVVSLGNCFRLAEFDEKVSATFGVLVSRTTTGLRYRLTDVDHDGELLVTDAPNNPGHFGGGLFTLDGSWIGLNARLLESVETNTQISAAIPTWRLREYITSLTTGQASDWSESSVEEARPEPPYHGIVLFDRGGRRSPPAYVDRVERDSPAHAIGLRSDDLIVRVGDSPVRTCAEFRKAIARFEAGDEVAVTFKRGERVLRESMKVEAPR